MMGQRLGRVIAALLLSLAALAAPARADVRVTFWSRDTGVSFPHSFITLKGTLDATGEVVDTSYGFTVVAVGPSALFGPVPAQVDVADKAYIRNSDAQFRVRISDAQYAAILAQVAEWSAPGFKWSLNSRNCVHFTAEAARRAGLVVVEDKRLMKKPKSFTLSLIPRNRERVTVIGLRGGEYWAKFPEEEVFGVPASGRRVVRPALAPRDTP